MELDTLVKRIEAATEPTAPQRRDWRIGCVGAGFIMRDCQLAAYREMGFQPAAIASLHRPHSEAVAAQYHIPKVYDSWQQMLDDGEADAGQTDEAASIYQGLMHCLVLDADALNVAADLIGSITDPAQQAELNAIYETRMDEMSA